MKNTSFPFFLALILSLGCDANPDERTLISSPRLLAVQSSPPAMLGIDGAVVLRALAIDGDGQELPVEPVQFRVCNPWEFLIDPERDCPASTSLRLSAKEFSAQDVLDFYPPPSSTGEFGQSPGPGDACSSPSLLEIPIVAELQVDELTLLTVKRIPVYFGEVTKQNPQIEDIEIVSQGEGKHVLSISIDEDSLDLECRNDVELREAIRIYLYSTNGSFENSSVDLVPTPEGNVEPAEVFWTSLGEPATLLFVAVDNDGGVDWKILSL